MIKKLFYSSNIAFIALYIALAWHNRFTSDDFCSIVNLHHYGIFKGAAFLYNMYCTRWLSVLVVHIVLSLMPYTNALFLFSIITIIGIILSFSYLLKNILHLFFSYQLNTFLLLNSGVFIANAFFYSSLNIGETWFWLSATPTYLWSFICFILGCGIIISNNKHSILKTVILSLCFFYIGGSSETFAAVLLLILSGGFIRLYFFKISLLERKIYLSRLCIAFLFCFVSLIILYLGHGNIVRRSLIGEISLSRAFVLNIETTGWIGLHWLSRIVPVVLLFSVPFIYAGFVLSNKNAMQKESMATLKISLLKASLIYGLLVFIINYPITYLLCGIAPGRALLPVSFLTWVLFAFCFFYAGYKKNIAEKTAKRLIAVALTLCLLFNSYNAIIQFIITGEYAVKYDNLMNELKSKGANQSIIVVLPLPLSGMLTPLDISTDSTANNNRFIKESMGLKADIMLAK